MQMNRVGKKPLRERLLDIVKKGIGKTYMKSDAPVNKDDEKQLTEKLLEIAKNEIRITYRKSDTPIPVLNSKIGGKPAVPPNFAWPHYTGLAYGEKESKNRPLSFMVQLNLKDIADIDEENLLPKSGILSFFYELETMTWGFDPKDKGSAKVFYFPNDHDLSIADFPDGLEEYAKLPELAVDLKQHISIPGYCELGDTAEYNWHEYDECCAKLGYEPDELGDRTKLFGYPDVIQNPMEEKCETVTRGYRLGCPEDYAKIPEEEKTDIKAKANEWIMLFQMGTVTDDDYELMFGDCGHIYFWIKKADLKNGNFDNIWLVLQCG